MNKVIFSLVNFKNLSLIQELIKKKFMKKNKEK